MATPPSSLPYDPVWSKGPEKGPSPSKFAAWVGIRITDINYSTGQVRFQIGNGIWIAAGSQFYNTNLKVSYSRTIDGSAIGFQGQMSEGNVTMPYTNSSVYWIHGNWHDIGWKKPGQVIKLSARGYYTAGSGTLYDSSITKSYTVPEYITKPNPPTNVKVSKSSNTATITWTNGATSTTKPITNTCVDRSVNDGSYSAISNPVWLSSTTTKWIDSTLQNNNKYKYLVRHKNSVGNSNATYTIAIYTTPPAPTNCVAIKKDNIVNLSCSVSNINYYNKCVWQRSSSPDFPSASTVTLPITGTSGQDTTTLETPYYRVQSVAQIDPSGSQTPPKSAWSTCSLSKTVSIWIQIPDNNSIKNVWVQQ